MRHVASSERDTHVRRGTNNIARCSLKLNALLWDFCRGMLLREKRKVKLKELFIEVGKIWRTELLCASHQLLPLQINGTWQCWSMNYKRKMDTYLKLVR